MLMCMLVLSVSLVLQTVLTFCLFATLLSPHELVLVPICESWLTMELWQCCRVAAW